MDFKEGVELAKQGLLLKEDVVNHPSHYAQYKGLEIIDLTEQMNFNKGNAVKYIARAGFKDPETEVQDLEKAVWYINREIERLLKRKIECFEERAARVEENSNGS